MNSEIHQAVSGLLCGLPTRSPADGWCPEAAAAAIDLLNRNGWMRVGLSDSLGGSGGELFDVSQVVAACVSSGRTLAVADSMVANRMLQLAGLRLGDSQCVLTVPKPASADADGNLDVVAARVPWGRLASDFVVVTEVGDQAWVNIVDARAAVVSPAVNLADEPRDTVALSAVAPRASAPTGLPLDVALGQLHLAGALARAMQISAAAAVVLELTTNYCAQRRQFGRAIKNFQAVQQQLAALAGETAVAEAAVMHAMLLIVDGAATLPVAPVAVAKIRTSTAAGEIARIGHQLHGAIGITAEYTLHQLSRALWSWRVEYGDERYWARVLNDELKTPATPPWHQLADMLPAADAG